MSAIDEPGIIFIFVVGELPGETGLFGLEHMPDVKTIACAMKNRSNRKIEYEGDHKIVHCDRQLRDVEFTAPGNFELSEDIFTSP